ncbi:MAG: hypothetical protein H6709_17620 [Kofleriaceae bacterium]|nr:hypothetical protein [Kofleriaceae bacterium]MCB9573903.1 hypothetical protein [Kofleriaceae bacterium]
MKPLTTLALILSIVAAAAAAAAPARAGTETTTAAAAPAAPAAHLDLEVDPTAYVFGGFSVHLGLGWGHLRLDLGAYGMDVPRWFHGNDGFDAHFDGAGAKLQWFPRAAQRGAFVDVSTGWVRQHVARGGASARNDALGVGVDAGWRFALPADFYVTPWAGVGYQLGADDVMLDGHTFHNRAITVFAAVHVGYSFR